MDANVTLKPSKNLYHDDIFDSAYLVLFNIESLLIMLGNLLVITVILRYVLWLFKTVERFIEVRLSIIAICSFCEYNLVQVIGILQVGFIPRTKNTYRSGMVNSKSFVGKVLLRIKRKFELNQDL